ncbi:MAG: hypothetical protein CW716_10660 [Candidatus Bathyarchaeum sp.]|nr:MAG: hypothetical protein CW716_10660 [Candidatus Bathyarchaeum sp.]
MRELKYPINIYSKLPKPKQQIRLTRERKKVKALKNVKAISKILVILLLLLALIIGSIFSYLILAGYYLNLGIEVPEKTTISVIDAGLDTQNTGEFNITLLNPTYSPTEATIKEIWVATADNTVHQVTDTDPELPYTLNKGEEKTYNCDWDWGSYTSQTLKIIVLVEDGSGAVYEVETAAVGLEITSTVFNPEYSEHFNVSIRNAAGSASALNVTKITVTMENGTEFQVHQITPSIPKLLEIGTTTTFMCEWNWTEYRGMNVTVNAFTSEGYAFHREATTPKKAQLSITDPVFATANMTYFNITVFNSEYSIDVANLTTVEVIFSNYTSLEVSVEAPPALPYTIPIGESVTLKCLWDWSNARQETIGIYVKTSEGYLGYLSQTTP